MCSVCDRAKFPHAFAAVRNDPQLHSMKLVFEDGGILWEVMESLKCTPGDRGC